MTIDSDRLAHLKRIALEMTDGNQQHAEEWLQSPLTVLGDAAPLEHARTESGYSDVIDLIGRIRTGTFS